MKAVFKLIMFTLFLSLLAADVTNAQIEEWSRWKRIQLPNSPPSVFGKFNLSYCESESLLYFDCMDRYFMEEGGIIYTSKLDSVDQYGYDRWSEPVALPDPINIAGFISAMADIVPSGDTLYFCSDRQGTRGGLDIWFSVRTNGLWSEPINLGDSVNTYLNEFAPDYSPVSGMLYFDRPESTRVHPKIYSCRRVGDNTWALATELPGIINIPGNTTYGPSFDDVYQDLYFTSSDPQQEINSISRSHYLGGQWTAPVVLSDSVNGFYYPNICQRVTTENPDISGNKLFYNKHVWEANYCIDFVSFLMYSEALVTSIDEDEVNSPRYSYKVFPNPSNSAFTISVQSEIKTFSVNIYNVLGQKIRTFEEKENTTLVWNGDDDYGKPLSSGVYFISVLLSDQQSAKKVLLLR